MAAPTPVTVLVRYKAQPGQVETAHRELDRLVATVVAQEPACLSIRLYQDPADDTGFLLYERWTDHGHYVGPHMQTPHLQAFIAKAREFLAGPPEITFWRLLGEHARD